MTRKIGLIQTTGIGDIIIALPIADFFLAQGADVHWPIRAQWLAAFRQANSQIQFIGIPADDPGQFYETPMGVLRERGCDRILSLYNHLAVDPGACNAQLARHLKFDEYKYAVAGVPFERKWTLRIRRDGQREQALYERLCITGPYILIHDLGSNFTAEWSLPPDTLKNFQLIRIAALTDNPLDWLLAIERSSKLILIDSCFANLVEQLNFPNEKYLILRSQVQQTPVFKNRWHFI